MNFSLLKDKKGFEHLDIPKAYHPFIFGPFNEVVNQIKKETGARINIPPPSVNKDELTIAGEKEAVALAKEKILKIYEEKVSTHIGIFSYLLPGIKIKLLKIHLIHFQENRTKN